MTLMCTLKIAFGNTPLFLAAENYDEDLFKFVA